MYTPGNLRRAGGASAIAGCFGKWGALPIIIPATLSKAMADGSSAAGVVLHAVGVEKLNGGACSEVIAIDLDGLIDPLHASLESRRVSDGLEQDKRVGHRAEGVRIRAAPDPEAGGALPGQECGTGGDFDERVTGVECIQTGETNKWDIMAVIERNLCTPRPL